MRDAVLEAEAKALVGQVLDGRYRLESVLGHGGMGLVFRAMQTSMDRPVAVKTLHPQLAMAPLFFERFKREAEVASRLHHPNIITIFDFGRTADNHCYYVMELLEGESLRQRIKRDGPMSVRQATAVIEQVAIGVAHAHKQGVIHRDIKPHNVMITAVDGAEYVKVLDFGLVKAMEADDDEQLTSTGQVLGTPQYMPPEQAGGEDVDQRSDLYSLTGVLYYCLTGHSPYGANTVRKALQAALTKKPNPVAEHRHGAPIPEALERLLVKGLSSEKADRYQTAEAFIEALHAALATAPDAELDALPKRTNEGSSKDVGSGSSSAHHRDGSRARAKSVAVAKPLPKSGQSVHRAPEPQPSLLSSAGFLLSVAAALVAIIVGALWWKYEKTSEREAAQQVVIAQPPPPLPPPPVEVPLNVTVRTTPPGAEVIENDVVIGTTPLTTSWKRNAPRVLRFRSKGFIELAKTLRPEGDQTFDFSLEAVPVAAPPPTDDKGKKPKRKDDDIEAFE